MIVFPHRQNVINVEEGRHGIQLKQDHHCFLNFLFLCLLMKVGYTRVFE